MPRGRLRCSWVAAVGQHALEHNVRFLGGWKDSSVAKMRRVSERAVMARAAEGSLEVDGLGQRRLDSLEGRSVGPACE